MQSTSLVRSIKSWMAGSGPAMTRKGPSGHDAEGAPGQDAEGVSGHDAEGVSGHDAEGAPGHDAEVACVTFQQFLMPG